MSKKCLFSPSNGKSEWMKCKENAINKILMCSKNRGDDIYKQIDTLKLSKQVNDSDSNENTFLWCHKGCYCSYTSATRNQGSRKRPASCPPPSERVLKSHVPAFSREDFKTRCFLCTKLCIPKDCKHPDRWHPWSVCEKEVSGCVSFKDTLLDICDQRQDSWSKEVFVRLQAVSTSMPAYDGRYHVDCMNSFRHIPKDSTNSAFNQPMIDISIKAVVNHMNKVSKALTCTVTELYDIFKNANGDLTKKQMMNKLSQYFGEELVIIRIPGCETEVGLIVKLGKMLKVIRKKNEYENEDNDEVDEVARQINAEVKGINLSCDYDLSDFHYEKMIDSTSRTLLRVVSSLVSNGHITKKSLSLAQCIQQHVGSARRNQTSLGLALKLHHKFGSYELIQLLHSHGLISPYDEVMRFRKSAAKFVSTNKEQYHKCLGLTTEIGPIFSWCDNYDLWISSPNGTKTTHAMVSEYTVHPKEPTSSIDKIQIGVMNLQIPRLKKTEASALSLLQALNKNLLNITKALIK